MAATHPKIVLSRKKQKAFLSVLSRTGKIGVAAEAAGYTNTRFVRKLRNRDAEFAKKWDDAVDAAGDILEDEAIRRAVDGVEKAVYFQGKIVGYESHYSDQMLMFLLKGNRPDKFASRSQIDATLSANIGVALLPMTAPAMEDWQRAAIDVHDAQRLDKIVDGEFVEVDVKAEPTKPSQIGRGS